MKEYLKYALVYDLVFLSNYDGDVSRDIPVLPNIDVPVLPNTDVPTLPNPYNRFAWVDYILPWRWPIWEDDDDESDYWDDPISKTLREEAEKTEIERIKRREESRRKLIRKLQDKLNEDIENGTVATKGDLIIR